MGHGCVKTGQPSPKALTTPNVGLTSVQVAPSNLTRIGLRVVNLSVSQTLWVSPGNVPAQKGSGSVPVQPLQFLDFESFTNAMNAVYDFGAGDITVWEMYE